MKFQQKNQEYAADDRVYTDNNLFTPQQPRDLYWMQDQKPDFQYQPNKNADY